MPNRMGTVVKKAGAKGHCMLLIFFLILLMFTVIFFYTHLIDFLLISKLIQFRITFPVQEFCDGEFSAIVIENVIDISK